MEKMSRSFAIAPVAAPGGGWLGIAPLPGRSGSLAADLSVIAAWNPALVVSMTTAAEMAAAGAGELEGELAKAGIGWRHFPVTDYGTPEPADKRWPPLTERLHDILDAGGRVLLHCHGGKGRSGMVATRMLVERGVDPADALAMVRAARPGAVETREQEEWSAEGIRTRRRS